MPRYLIPAYFDLLISGLYTKAIEKSWSLMSSSFVHNQALASFDIAAGSSFVRSLALGSILFNGYLADSKLPDTVISNSAASVMLSLSAGLPHFSVSYMRNWGRDTFISLRG